MWRASKAPLLGLHRSIGPCKSASALHTHHLRHLMDKAVAGCTRQSFQQSCSGPCSTSYTHPVSLHRLRWGSASARQHAVPPRGSAAGVEADGCNLAGNTAHHGRSSAAVSTPRAQPSAVRSPVSTRVATPMAPTEAVRESEGDQPPDAEQPAPFERMADDADSAYADLAGIVPTDALYDVLDLRKELAHFLREADKPLSAGLSGLQEIASTANWALPVSAVHDSGSKPALHRPWLSCPCTSITLSPPSSGL